MSDIGRRLQRLENATGGIGRTFVVFSGGATERAIYEMMTREHGIMVGPRDEIVHFATIYEDENGHPLPNLAPPTYQPANTAPRRRV